MPHFFVAQFSKWPILRCQILQLPNFLLPFFSCLFPLAFMPFTIVLTFPLYIAVIRLVALCTVAHFFVAQIFLCRFSAVICRYWPFLCCIFSLSNWPIAQFFADFFQLPFSVEVFTFCRCCYFLLHRHYTVFCLIYCCQFFPLPKIPDAVSSRLHRCCLFTLGAFFVAQFFHCPTFRCSFLRLRNFLLPIFSVAFFFCCRFCLLTLLLPFFYINVIRFVDLLTGPDSSVEQIFVCLSSAVT